MIVSIQHVSVSFRENIALRDISVDIEEGAFVSVIGPNGAGKTTLITVINGLGNIRSGSVTVCGQALTRKNARTLRKSIGYVPQHVNIDVRSPISVREAVSIGRYGKNGLMRRWTAQDEAMVREAMHTVGIDHLAAKPIGHLSGGEHQKVSIARALAQEPRIILLDEPTSNLDPKSQDDVLRLVERIYRERRYTIVFVTHILGHIPAICSQVVLMKKGRILFSGGSDEGLREDRLTELYECPLQVGTINGKRHFHVGNAHV